MNVLYLGPPRADFQAYLREFGDDVVRSEDPLTGAAVEGVDRVVSYGYRHMIGGDIIARFGRRAVNLHIALLPWNRGADPNLWSILEDTPKGVTIHVIDEGLDTGPVIAQREVALEPGDTLATSYARLSAQVEALFRGVWPSIRDGHAVVTPQASGGSSHRAADKVAYAHLLADGWDTPAAALVGAALGREERT